MKRIVVLGGSGFLGSRVVKALSKLADIEVKVASRRGELRVDVTKPETFEALAGADLIIDLTDATSTRPDAAVAWCLERGMTVIEATSDAPCVERLYRKHAQSPKGRLIVGGGIFTGVSNLLAREAWLTGAPASSITLGIATSPFSGAGSGTIALMVHALAIAAVRFIEGERREVTQLEAGPALPFGGVTRPTVRSSMAEGFMLQQSLKARNVDVFLAPKPSALATMFLATPPVMFTSAPGQWLLRAYFTFLRRVVLRSIPTGVEMMARADQRPPITVHARDGMMAAAWALAAMAEAVISGAAHEPGAVFIDQVTSLRPIIDRANALAGQQVFRFLEPGEQHAGHRRSN